jgi:tetratricopeptide (TPR) repeat protein
MRTRLLFLLSAILSLNFLTLHAQPSEEDRRYKLAQGYEESNDLKNASRIYRELYDQDPQSDIYFEGIRRTYMAMLRFNELLPIVEERVSRRSRDVATRTLYAELLNRNQRRDEAEQEWNNAIELRPDDLNTYFVVAQSQIDNQLFEKAAATYKQGRRRLGDATAFADQLAQIYGLLGRFEDATNEYLGLLAQNSSRLGFVMSGLGQFTTNPKGADAAIDAVKEAIGSRPGYLPFVELLSWLYTERGDDENAFETSKRLDELRNANGSNIYGFADRALREGKYDIAIRALDYFMTTYPKSNPLYTSVIFSYTRALNGRYHSAGSPSKSEAQKLLERYRTLVGENAGTVSAAEAMLEIAHLQADDLDEPKDAIETIERLRREFPKFPSLPEAMLLEGDLQLRVGQIAGAQELYRIGSGTILQGRDGERYRDLSALRFAETLFYQGEFKQAVDSFTALTQNTGSEVTNDALGYLFILQENFERFDAALQHYASGRLMLLQHNWEKGISDMDAAVAAGRESSLADDALIYKAQAQEAMGASRDAVTTLLGLVSSYADGTEADRALFHAAELEETALNDRAKATELYTRLLTEYPASPFINRARQRIRALRGES